jgi:hypothetical protein
MSIEITDDYEYHLNRMNRSAQNIQLGTYLKELTDQDEFQYAGVRVAPSITDNNNGSLTVGEGTYSLYPDSSGSSVLKIYTVSGSTFILADSVTTYIYVSILSGSPILGASTDFDTIPGTKYINVIPIVTVYRYGNLINIIDWDEQGLALSEKLLYRAVDTDRFNRTRGLILSEYGTRNVAISSGTVWYGANKLDIQNFSSGSAPSYMYLIGQEGGVWSGSIVTQIENLRYQGTNGLVPITGNKYTVNWIYRIISNVKRYAVIVLGTSEYTHNQALESQPPASLPNIVGSQALMVGRMIIQKGVSYAEHIDSAFDVLFAPTDLDHNLLYNLQGGTTDQYYHLSASQINIFNSYTSVISASANLTLSNNDYVVLVSGSSTLYLPSAIGNIGKQYNIKNIGTNIINVIASGSQTIDSASSIIIENQYSSLQICCNGANWYII